MKGSVQKFECIEYNYHFAECERAAEIRKLLYIVVVDVLFFVEKTATGSFALMMNLSRMA